MIATVAWLAGFVALAIAATRATRRARRSPGETVERGAIAIAAVAALALGLAAAWVWTPSTERTDEPGHARLFVRAVASPLPDGRAVIGFGADATLRLPPSYALAEEARGRDLIDVFAVGTAGLAIAPHPRIEPSPTRLLLATAPHAHDAPPLEVADAIALATAQLDHGRCGAPTVAAPEIEPAIAIAVVCDGPQPVAAMIVERDAVPRGAAVRVTPLVWRAPRFVAHQLELDGGVAIELGRADDATPGVRHWDVPAPAGLPRLVIPPEDPSAPCAAWAERDRAFGGIATSVGDTDAIACVLPYLAPYVLEVRRLVPDETGVLARAVWAAGLFTTVGLCGLIALATRRRGSLTATRFARALIGAWAGAGFAAIAVLRLAWAHRVDMLRDLEPIGARVLANQVTIVLLAGALAARICAERARLGVIAWAIVVAGGGWALRLDLAAAWATRAAGAQLVLSALVAIAPLAMPAVRAIRVRAPSGVPLIPAITPATAALLAIAITAVLAPPLVLVKLALAWATVIAAYRALRASRGRGRLVASAATMLALAALARLDAGVTVAIAGPGVIAAIVMLGHDARFGDADRARLAGYARDHRPVVLAHAALFGGTAVLAGVWALVAAPDDLAIAMTRGALHGLLVIAAAMLAIGAVARWRGGRSLPWFAAAAVLAALWLGRDHVIARAVDGSSAASQRVAQILAPGSGLLRDPEGFAAGSTARAATAIEGDPWRGEGWFGAAIADPGVRLSIENDYAPVLILRERGVLGVAAVLALLLGFVAALWWIAGERFAHGSAAQRTRRVVTCVLGALIVYQPLAALGLVPLTGIAWPGLGIDSPTDAWMLLLLVLGVVAWGRDGLPTDDERHDRELRASRAFRTANRATTAAAALALSAALIIVGRGALAAAHRSGDVFTGAAPAALTAWRYATGLACTVGAVEGDARALVPTDLIGAPLDADTARFHAALRSRWADDRPALVAAMSRFLDEPGHPCAAVGPWRMTASVARDGAARCVARWRVGLPEVAVAAEANGPHRGRGRCLVTTTRDPLEVHAHATAPAPRLRLVSDAMGAAARDRGELASGHLIARLRPGAGAVDAGSREGAGLLVGDRIALAPGLEVALAADRVVVRVAATAPPVAMLEAGPAGAWTVVAMRGEVALERTAILVVGDAHRRRTWTFRGARAGATVSPLLADDLVRVHDASAPRRRYVYGGDLPELGWIDPYRAAGSLGLDGWVHAAVAEEPSAILAPAPSSPTPTPPSTPSSSPTPSWTDAALARPYCGTLAPPPTPSPCAPSATDGVIECRVTVQPELELQLRNLTELIAADPTAWAGKGIPPTRAAFLVERGDTGAILASGEVVPGRASSAFSPGNPGLDRYLARLRDDRDPWTGADLAPSESSAERVDWNQPIAAGSAIKPLVARAAELAAPSDLAALSLATDGPEITAGACHRGKRSFRPIFGHCAPTPLVTAAERFDLHDYLARSSNWYQAALGIIGLALPFDEHTALTIASEPIDPFTLRASSIDRVPAATPLAISRDGHRVIAGKTVYLEGLRSTPLWTRFESIVGRPLCTPSDPACGRELDRRDLCAVRALPIASPSPDQRALIALGPAAFTLSEKRTSTVAIVDYLQFLRGSGLHPLGSLAQLTDAFTRVVYDRPGTDGRFRLAASWFPSPTIGVAPTWDCATGDAPVESVIGGGGGLCGVVQPGGTAAKALRAVLADPRVIVYGAKTGTIDALADVSEKTRACEAWNQRHTIPGRPASTTAQPYWLTCGRSAPDDSLLVIAFGVKTAHGVVPLTLAIDLQRSGKGVAASIARHYIDALVAYVSEPGP
ncbi:MAG: hypothetical protein K8W52_20815 [Deltaproteobacteria bacterium]|nr:hypothetical protein [Deltaproteobacteria bacterium]